MAGPEQAQLLRSGRGRGGLDSALMDPTFFSLDVSRLGRRRWGSSWGACSEGAEGLKAKFLPLGLGSPIPLVLRGSGGVRISRFVFQSLFSFAVLVPVIPACRLQKSVVGIVLLDERSKTRDILDVKLKKERIILAIYGHEHVFFPVRSE